MTNIKVALDSRLVKPGEYFIPVIGDEDDGHKYIDSAIQNGAKGIIEADELYKIASEKLQEINPKIIAITGSVGKSTMRDFLTTMLSQKYRVCKGSLNTKLGLAVNIINDLKEGDEFFVAETGMDRVGELTETGNFLNPHAVVITNISESHMLKLGSLEAIKKAKSELLYTLRPGGVAFINWDNENIRDVIEKNFNDLLVQKYSFSDPLPYLPTQLLGSHNYLNSVGAYKVGQYFGLSDDELIKGLKALTTPKGRLKIIEGINDSIIIDDTYNSSPVSAKYALDAVTNYYKSQNLTGRKIAVLGGMSELGDFEDRGHDLVGDYVVAEGFDELVLVDELGAKISNSEKLKNSNVHVLMSADVKSAGELVKTKLKPQKGDIILVKASQSKRLEITVELLMKNPSDAEKLLVRQDARWK